jgi:hypothetical protein
LSLRLADLGATFPFRALACGRVIGGRLPDGRAINSESLSRFCASTSFMKVAIDAQRAHPPFSHDPTSQFDNRAALNAPRPCS